MTWCVMYLKLVNFEILIKINKLWRRLKNQVDLNTLIAVKER